MPHNACTLAHEYTYEYNVKGVSFDKIGMRQVASAMYKGVCDEISQNGGSVAIECHSSV